MSNEFDAAVAATMQPDQGQAARVGFSVAADTNPDAYAEAQRVARRTGVPVDTVLNMPKEMKQQDTMGTIDFDALAKTAPATASLLSDIERAKVAHDNLPSMTAIERSFLGNITEPVQRGLAQGRRGLTLLFNQMGIFKGLERQQAAAAAAHGISYDPSIELAVRLAQQQREVERYPVPDDIAQGMQDISNAQTMGDAFTAIRTNPRAVLETTLQSLGASAPALVGAAGGSVFGPGGTATGAGLGSFAVEYSNTLQDVMAEKGVNGTDSMSIHAALNNPELMAAAREKALKRGIPVAIFDALTAGLAGKLLAGAKPTVGSVGARAAGELGLQAGGGAAGEAGAQLATGEYKPGDILMEAFAEMPTAIIEVPGNYRHAMESAQRAQKGAEFIDNLNKLVQADKLVARDPQTFEQFVAQAAEAGPVQQVFIDAQTLMQSGVAQQVAAVSPAVASQLATAAQTGGQIAIPVEEYAARIAPTEYAQGLLDHLKTEPEGFSRAEAQQFMQSHAEELQAEVERTLAEKQVDDTFKASAEVVRNEIRTQLDTAARFTPQVNDAYSAMVGNFYATMAAKTGTTPEELFQRYPLKIAAERIDGPQFDQGQAPAGAQPGEVYNQSRKGKRDDYTLDLFGVPDNTRADTPAGQPAGQPAAGRQERPLSRDDAPGTYAARTELVEENTRELGTDRVSTPQEAAQALAYLAKGAVERFDALVTDADGKPLAIVGAFKGALTQASVFPSTLAAEAFRVNGAANIWFAHNHPSGTNELSNADRQLHSNLAEVFRGSEIKARGIFAIAGKEGTGRNWVFEPTPESRYNPESDVRGATTAPAATASVPVVERVYSGGGAAVLSPVVLGNAGDELLLSMHFNLESTQSTEHVLLKANILSSQQHVMNNTSSASPWHKHAVKFQHVDPRVVLLVNELLA